MSVVLLLYIRMLLNNIKQQHTVAALQCGTGVMTTDIATRADVPCRPSQRAAEGLLTTKITHLVTVD